MNKFSLAKIDKKNIPAGVLTFALGFTGFFIGLSLESTYNYITPETGISSRRATPVFGLAVVGIFIGVGLVWFFERVGLFKSNLVSKSLSKK